MQNSAAAPTRCPSACRHCGVRRFLSGRYIVRLMKADGHAELARAAFRVRR